MRDTADKIWSGPIENHTCSNEFRNLKALNHPWALWIQIASHLVDICQLAAYEGFDPELKHDDEQSQREIESVWPMVVARAYASLERLHGKHFNESM